MGSRHKVIATLLLFVIASALVVLATRSDAVERRSAQVRFSNLYKDEQDTGARASVGYIFWRAWVQLTRDMNRTELPEVVPLDIDDLAKRPFAVAWFGHSTMLMRAGSKWILLDPVFSGTAGPVQGFGPKRLTRLPVAWQGLPRIDFVLISHDHYDHLDLATMKLLAGQAGGPPQFLVGRGLKPWFDSNVGVGVEEFDWWQDHVDGDLKLTFVPAQHSSGRGLWNKNTTLWGGWVVERADTRVYYAGDTAYVTELFRDIRARVGPIHLAALPIGAYRPRELMQHEHTDPDDAVQAHIDLGAARSFGVHWGTFQLGDEEPIQPARDLAEAFAVRGTRDFKLLPVGGLMDVSVTVPTDSL